MQEALFQNLANLIEQSDGNMVPVPAFEEDILSIEDIPAFRIELLRQAIQRIIIPVMDRT